jgi:hypothetical protein
MPKRKRPTLQQLEAHSAPIMSAMGTTLTDTERAIYWHVRKAGPSTSQDLLDARNEIGACESGIRNALTDLVKLGLLTRRHGTYPYVHEAVTHFPLDDAQKLCQDEREVARCLSGCGTDRFISLALDFFWRAKPVLRMGKGLSGRYLVYGVSYKGGFKERVSVSLVEQHEYKPDYHVHISPAWFENIGADAPLISLLEADLGAYPWAYTYWVRRNEGKLPRYLLPGQEAAIMEELNDA